MRPTFILHKSKSSTQWLARQSRDPYVKRRLSPSAFPSTTGSLSQSPASSLDADASASEVVARPVLLPSIQYRARSAFKLLEINSHPSMGGFLDYEDVNAVVDLGGAPGGWSQVVAAKFGWLGNSDAEGVLVTENRTQVNKQAVEAENSNIDEGDQFDYHPKKKQKPKKAKKPPPVEEDLSGWDPLNVDNLLPESSIGRTSTKGRGTIIAVDLLPILSIPGVQTIRGDFHDPSTSESIQRLLCHSSNTFLKADVILSDIASNSTGNTAHDIQSSLSICESVLEFAKWNLRSAESVGRRKGGVLLMKFFSHPLLDAFRRESLEPNFNYVHYVKPDSSRSGSKEGYFLCQGWIP
ncbi:FtsJ-like methyltransferase-domain-containing protein [Crepidotus variabilis]|uniref:rRNA methyltransferase 2, mitochondrial n=1 Tax=Crepidotus variabilis TaxID=179855 RepID=A0A9P6E5D0_9AGAR|nr:FtsJ-like methyltransferase-domain-containing protein [Crepidotus variabilis]